MDNDKIEVSLDSCDVLSDKFILKPIEPIKSYMMVSTGEESDFDNEEVSEAKEHVFLQRL